MRYCRFLLDGKVAHYGAVENRNGVETITRLLPSPEDASAAAASVGEFQPLPLGEAKLLAPVTPSKIVCIGRNYRDHAAELGNDVPREPLLFLKPPSSIIASGDQIEMPSLSQRVDYEGELGIVIGRRARHIGAAEDVRGYIRGYTIVNDVTARDLQKSDGQWSRAKGFDTFCPVGPLVTDEIDPFAGIRVQTHLNGELRQDGTTRDLIFPIDHLLRYITAAMTLMPGDLVATGTPAGVGPMQPGDTVSVTVEGIGTLLNRAERGSTASN
ncbi:fumarylacetoacetate hydrolase family protein [Acidipila rosea]|uniref:2-keto-4-pentenoate hydratase/2-oxohepta-3-ene-1,7-dioic acid hydratase in catechol pathway n=1 Tax=Acidipila rosea TaxID=768535 RepID=A0A4R1L0X3_9BACT|nr:fumarylacetoacetate hydrolase family protein [Acidipila rosea]TCK71568.1 2-keto-4-pentenoate hydratase/2-oxohepta-3-ene-1,7-dioic acid hydratase in catechol pathway [Acidipila rosea]